MNLCTHAITGSHNPSHQPIYVCNTCHHHHHHHRQEATIPLPNIHTTQTTIADVEVVDNIDDDDDEEEEGNRSTESSLSLPLPSCICQSCAEVCHANHDVVYVGIGPCTCDCLYLQSEDAKNYPKDDNETNNAATTTTTTNTTTSTVGHNCKLVDDSLKYAIQFGFHRRNGPLNVPLRQNVPPPFLPTTNNTAFDCNDDPKKNGSPLDSTMDINDYTQCMECDSTIGGYLYESYTIFPNDDDDDDDSAPVDKEDIDTNNMDEACANKCLHPFCDNLILQALALDACSQDTFWMPSFHDEKCKNSNDNHDFVDANQVKKAASSSNNDTPHDSFCELELIAREIYQHHVRRYISPSFPTIPPSLGGAEWWVQVKSAESSSSFHTPVNLHYDKDETLAELFGLGSFPTLSTVTYLTDANENAPTIVFPRTYHDDMDIPIESMLVSHTVRGKHLVFDGRLLHGAPEHPSLLRHSNRVCKRSSTGSSHDEEKTELLSTMIKSSLRVTLLVNVWLSGKPAGVHVLPEWIRSKIQSATRSKTRISMGRRPLTFVQRPTSTFSLRGRASIVPEGGSILLPFVSNRHAYRMDGKYSMDKDNDEYCVDDGIEYASVGVNTLSRGRRDDADDDNDTHLRSIVETSEKDNNDEEDEEDEEELYLALSSFPTAECVKSETDTFVVSFDDGHSARIVRGDELEDISRQTQCPWKRFAMEGVVQNGISDAAMFLSYLRRNTPPFILSILDELKLRHGMDMTTYPIDHICYRTESFEQYSRLVNELKIAIQDFRLLTESKIGGRLIATFKLSRPITIQCTNGSRLLEVVEIPSPKVGSPYRAGLEHIEFVIGDKLLTSPINSHTHRSVLTNWMSKYPLISWNCKALEKMCNPDIAMMLDIAKLGRVNVKFHLMQLEDVIKYENSQSNTKQ